MNFTFRDAVRQLAIAPRPSLSSSGNPKPVSVSSRRKTTKLADQVLKIWRRGFFFFFFPNLLSSLILFVSQAKRTLTDYPDDLPDDNKHHYLKRFFISVSLLFRRKLFSSCWLKTRTTTHRLSVTLLRGG